MLSISAQGPSRDFRADHILALRDCPTLSHCSLVRIFYCYSAIVNSMERLVISPRNRKSPLRRWWHAVFRFAAPEPSRLLLADPCSTPCFRWPTTSRVLGSKFFHPTSLTCSPAHLNGKRVFNTARPWRLSRSQAPSLSDRHWGPSQRMSLVLSDSSKSDVHSSEDEGGPCVRQANPKTCRQRRQWEIWTMFARSCLRCKRSLLPNFLSRSRLHEFALALSSHVTHAKPHFSSFVPGAQAQSFDKHLVPLL